VFGWFKVNQNACRNGPHRLIRMLGMRKINMLAETARVDIAGVASSILAMATIFLSNSAT